MATEINVTYGEVVRKMSEVEVPSGEATVTINLPAAVPVGKKLVLRIEIKGEMQDAS